MTLQFLRALFQHQMNPSSNFSSYRSSLKAAQWRSLGAAEDREKVCVSIIRCVYTCMCVCLDVDVCQLSSLGMAEDCRKVTCTYVSVWV